MTLLANLLYSQTRKWCNVINKTYKHTVYRLSTGHGNDLCCLDLVHMNHWLFGNSLVSMPFSDVGGFKGGGTDREPSLFLKAIELAAHLSVDSIDLRMDRVLPWLTNDFLSREAFEIARGEGLPSLAIQKHKVSMVLDLPASTEDLMAGFKSKLRSQIRRPLKEGMTFRIGKKECVDDFYKVFKVNMRDLGSPVHSKRLFEIMLDEFKISSDFILVYKGTKPVAGAMVVGNGPVLSNPWASSLREYRSASPNMLLYWAMLDYAVKRGYRRFDFGRSTPGEGTYAFKKQWGANPEPLYWYTVSLKHCRGSFQNKAEDDGSGRGLMVKAWQRLPVSASVFIGPLVRKHISL